MKRLSSSHVFVVFIVLCFDWDLSQALGADVEVQLGGFDFERCDSSAVLLDDDVDVFDKPNGRRLLELAGGRAVYLCDFESGYRRIVYPQDGTAVDCTMRIGDICPSGYVREPFMKRGLG